MVEPQCHVPVHSRSPSGSTGLASSGRLGPSLCPGPPLPPSTTNAESAEVSGDSLQSCPLPQPCWLAAPWAVHILMSDAPEHPCLVPALGLRTKPAPLACGSRGSILSSWPCSSCQEPFPIPCSACWPRLPLAHSLAQRAELGVPGSWAGAILEGLPGTGVQGRSDWPHRMSEEAQGWATAPGCSRWTPDRRGALPSCLTPCPSLQIPITQACLMEDIEQWLSTDVVSPAPSSPT